MPDQMEHEPIDEEDARYFFAQLVDGLSYMHEFNVSWRMTIYKRCDEIEPTAKYRSLIETSSLETCL